MDVSDDINTVVRELVDGIVGSVSPQRIILFGSAARGELKEHSDIDILVVMPDGVHRRKTAQKLYRALRGQGFAKDIVVVTESDIEEYGDNPSLVIQPALHEGRQIYHAA